MNITELQEPINIGEAGAALEIVPLGVSDGFLVNVPIDGRYRTQIELRANLYGVALFCFPTPTLWLPEEWQNSKLLWSNRDRTDPYAHLADDTYRDFVQNEGGKP